MRRYWIGLKYGLPYVFVRPHCPPCLRFNEKEWSFLHHPPAWAAPCTHQMAETTLHLGHVVQAVINSVDIDNLEDGVDKLRSLFPDATLLAALDLVDRDSVMRYKTTWGRYHYEVRGSTSTYTVFPRLGFSAPASCYCTCPAFAFTVLMSNSHLMCKHVLAVCLAEQLSKCVEFSLSDEDLVTRVTAHLP